MLEVIRGVLKRRLAAEAQVSLFGENTRRDLPCPYITIDVDFILSDPKQQAIEERPTDTIGKISRLYLKWSLSDQTMKPRPGHSYPLGGRDRDRTAAHPGAHD